jgi:hypothetical protein
VKEFCRQAGVQCSGYYEWRRKLSAEGKGEATFAEVKVRPVPRLLDDSVAAADAGPLEVRLAGRRSIVVPRGFDRRTLIELLDVLEAAAAGPAGREAGR